MNGGIGKKVQFIIMSIFLTWKSSIICESADAGLRLTSAKYEVGLGSLKERFAKKQAIIIAHMDALFKLEVVS